MNDTAIVGSSTLFAVDVATGIVTTLAQDHPSNVRVSANGSEVVFVAQGAAGAELLVVPTSGATAAIPQEYLFNGKVSPVYWGNDSTLVADRSGTPAPYGVLNGVYSIPVQTQ